MSMICLARKADSLEIHANGQCMTINGHYQPPRLLTLDPMRSLFSKRRSTLSQVRHQLHMMTGWVGMSVHAKRLLHEAKDMKDGDERRLEV